MSSNATVRVKAIADEPIDELVWRAVGQRIGLVESVLESNPGLAELGSILPVGTVVNVPLPQASAPATPLIQLWS